MKDQYRADCRPFPEGCRNCGDAPTGRFTYYCGAECREVFERDHFWGTARWTAIEWASVCLIGRPKNQARPICACCGRGHFGEGEVNHIVPVNGDRGFFSCSNHQENLEVLCHQCHVMATREQRRRGMFGPDGVPLALRAVELLTGLCEPVKARKLRLV